MNTPHRFESKHFNYSSTFQALRAILRTEGFRGLTVGLGPTLVRDVPFSGLYLMFYEHLKTLTPAELQMTHGSSVHFSCGIMAGFLASLVTQPADVIKTRLQISKEANKNIGSVIRQIYSQQGVAGFSAGQSKEPSPNTNPCPSGLVPRSLRRTLMAALAWTVYERMIKTIGLK